MNNLPSNFPKPKYWFGDRTKQGIIIGMEIYPPESYLASQYGSQWYYAVLPSRSSEDVEYLDEKIIDPLPPEGAREKVAAEIQQYQQALDALHKELASHG